MYLFIYEKGIHVGEVYMWMKCIEQWGVVNEREFRNIGKLVQMKVCVVCECCCLQVRMFRTGVSVCVDVGIEDTLIQQSSQMGCHINKSCRYNTVATTFPQGPHINKSCRYNMVVKIFRF